MLTGVLLERRFGWLRLLAESLWHHVDGVAGRSKQSVKYLVKLARQRARMLCRMIAETV